MGEGAGKTSAVQSPEGDRSCIGSHDEGQLQVAAIDLLWRVTLSPRGRLAPDFFSEDLVRSSALSRPYVDSQDRLKAETPNQKAELRTKKPKPPRTGPRRFSYLPLLLVLRSRRVLPVQFASQTIEVGVEGHEIGGPLKERFAAGFDRNAVQ